MSVLIHQESGYQYISHQQQQIPSQFLPLSERKSELKQFDQLFQYVSLLFFKQSLFCLSSSNIVITCQDQEYFISYCITVDNDSYELPLLSTSHDLVTRLSQSSPFTLVPSAHPKEPCFYSSNDSYLLIHILPSIPTLSRIPVYYLFSYYHSSILQPSSIFSHIQYQHFLQHHAILCMLLPVSSSPLLSMTIEKKSQRKRVSVIHSLSMLFRIHLQVFYLSISPLMDESLILAVIFRKMNAIMYSLCQGFPCHSNSEKCTSSLKKGM